MKNVNDDSIIKSNFDSNIIQFSKIVTMLNPFLVQQCKYNLKKCKLKNNKDYILSKKTLKITQNPF